MLRPILFTATALAAGAFALTPATSHAQNYQGSGYYGANAGYGGMPGHQAGPNDGYAYEPGRSTQSGDYGQGPNQGYYSANPSGGQDQGNYGNGAMGQYGYRGPSNPGSQQGYNGAGSNNQANPGWNQRAMSNNGPYGAAGPAGQAQTNGPEQDRGVIVLLVEHDRQVQALRDIQDQIRKAQQALQSGNTSQAEQALTQAEQRIRVATRADQTSDQQASGSGASGGAVSVRSDKTAQSVARSSATSPDAAGGSTGSLGSSPGTTGSGSSSNGSASKP